MAHLSIGLTGGIASGKSFVADQLERLGARIIDADALVRRIEEPGAEGLTRIVERFGGGVLNPDGTLDRAKLGQIVFHNDAARGDLNSIIHPLVRAERARIEESAPDGSIVVNVIPLLVETGQAGDFDSVIVVDVPEEVQIARLMARNGFSAAEARARIATQATRAERLAAAGYVIDNSGTRQQTTQQVEGLWNELKSGFETPYELLNRRH